MRMPATVRIDFRKMLRDHPEVLDYVGSKSDVNNLTRDELVKLADQLGINFLQRLSDGKIDDVARQSVIGMSTDQQILQPFKGQMEFPLKTIVFGQSQTSNFLLEYKYTPEWQFYCPDQRRLKYRHLSLTMELYSQATADLSNKDKSHSLGQIEWQLAPEAIWNLIRPIIIDDVNLQIDRHAWQLDQERREAVGLPLGDHTKTRWFKNQSDDKLQTTKKFNNQELLNVEDKFREREIESVIGSEKARDKALTENAAKSAFLAMMSHEIRTPMTSVLGLADMLLDDNLSASQRDKVEKLKGVGQSLIPILNDILDFSKIQAGKLEFENIDFDIQSLVGEVVEVMSSEAAAKGISLWLKVDSDVEPGFHSDPTRIRQILSNLIKNAIKFTADGGVTVSVQVTEKQDREVVLRFEITDTGIGIAKHRHDGLFESFTQSEPSISRRYEGTGLGLAISKWLTELMGGEIGFTSTEGHGSTFWFTIVGKVVTSEWVKSVRSVNPVNYFATRRLRVLLAEDDELNQMIIEAVLSRFNHMVEAVSDGEAAAEAARRGHYDLILMDMRMPKFDGLEAARIIRNQPGAKAEIPIIAITADAIPENHKRYLDAGMDGCVTKPVDLQKLLQAINQALGEDVHIAAEIG